MNIYVYWCQDTSASQPWHFFQVQICTGLSRLIRDPRKLPGSRIVASDGVQLSAKARQCSWPNRPRRFRSSHPGNMVKLGQTRRAKAYMHTYMHTYIHTCMPHIALHCIPLHYYRLDSVTRCCIILHYDTLHYFTLHYITYNYIAFHNITLQYVPLHYSTLITFITWHGMTLHYITKDETTLD